MSDNLDNTEKNTDVVIKCAYYPESTFYDIVIGTSICHPVNSYRVIALLWSRMFISLIIKIGFKLLGDRRCPALVSWPQLEDYQLRVGCNYKLANFYFVFQVLNGTGERRRLGAKGYKRQGSSAGITTQLEPRRRPLAALSIGCFYFTNYDRLRTTVTPTAPHGGMKKVQTMVYTTRYFFFPN